MTNMVMKQAGLTLLDRTLLQQVLKKYAEEVKKPTLQMLNELGRAYGLDAVAYIDEVAPGKFSIKIVRTSDLSVIWISSIFKPKLPVKLPKILARPAEGERAPYWSAGLWTGLGHMVNVVARRGWGLSSVGLVAAYSYFRYAYVDGGGVSLQLFYECPPPVIGKPINLLFKAAGTKFYLTSRVKLAVEYVWWGPGWITFFEPWVAGDLVLNYRLKENMVLHFGGFLGYPLTLDAPFGGLGIGIDFKF